MRCWTRCRASVERGDARLNRFSGRVEVACSRPEIREYLLAAMAEPAAFPKIPTAGEKATDLMLGIPEIPHDVD